MLEQSYERPVMQEVHVFGRRSGVCLCGYDFYEGPYLPAWARDNEVNLTCPKCKRENLITLPIDWRKS